MRRVSSGAGSPAALALATVLSVVQPLLVMVDVQFPGRTWTALAYALLVPGLAIAAWLRLPSRLASWGLAFAISIATQILVAMVMLQTGHWVPIASVLVPSLISWPFLFFSLRRPRALPDAHPTRKPMSARDRLAEFGLTPWLLLAALAFYAHAVTHTDQNRMTPYALISVMPITYVVSLAFIGAAAGLELVRLRQRQWWLGAVTVTLVVVLFTYQNGSDSVAGFPTAWLHAGYTDYIRTHGAILPNFDARFSWPGFFAATANLSVSAGLPDATGLLRWAPLLYNLLLIIPLLLLARRIGRNRVYAWFAVMLCFLGNWFEQDYFSPQATNLVLYLVVLSVLVWLGRAATSPVEVRVRGRIARWWHDGLRLSTARLARAIVVVRPPRAPGVDAHQYVAIGVLLVLVIAASVVSHQLTPVVTVLAVAVLAFSARTRLRFLWLAGGLVFALWFSYGATDFWDGRRSGAGRLDDRQRGRPPRGGFTGAPEAAIPPSRNLGWLPRAGLHRAGRTPSVPVAPRPDRTCLRPLQPHRRTELRRRGRRSLFPVRHAPVRDPVHRCPGDSGRAVAHPDPGRRDRSRPHCRGHGSRRDPRCQPAL